SPAFGPGRRSFWASIKTLRPRAAKKASSVRLIAPSCITAIAHRSTVDNCKQREPDLQTEWRLAKTYAIVVDGDIVSRHAIAGYLRHCGYRVVEAFDTNEAMK